MWLDAMPSGGVLLQSSYAGTCFRMLGESRADNEWCACMCSFKGQAIDIPCRWYVQMKTMFSLVRAKFAHRIAKLSCISG